MQFPDPTWVSRIESFLEMRLRETNAPPKLTEAMRYALMGGGKRLRPQFVYAAGAATGGDLELLDYAAAAIEMIHSYSLVHDDLPAMDDDALRHGQATVHLAYDEATAILVGDALQALAFQTASADHLPPIVVSRWIHDLARASGSDGMVGGQVLDLEAEERSISEAELATLHGKKTGALIRAAVTMGAFEAKAETRERLATFAIDVGLAFQVADDILDVTTASEKLGKDQNSDAAQGKTTYVTLLGINHARVKAAACVERALAAIDDMDERADGLRDLARYAVERDY